MGFSDVIAESSFSIIYFAGLMVAAITNHDCYSELGFRNRQKPTKQSFIKPDTT